MNRPALVIERARHHAGASGYCRLADTLVGEGHAVLGTHPFPRRGTWRLVQPLVRRSGLTWYGAEAFFTEMWTAGVIAWRHPVVHFLHGENSYRYAAAIPGSPRRRLVATFHLPPSVFAQYVRGGRHLERLDAVILVARSQRAILDEFGHRPPAFVVPHGVDVDFFRFSVPSARSASCLFVGQWLRDFATLKDVIAHVLAAMPEARFRLVLPPERAVSWPPTPGVEVCSGLDDTAYLRCYEEAALVVMPLLDATANNVVLESMACGRALVVTDVGGVRDYVDESCACLTPAGDSVAMAGAVCRLLKDQDLRERMGRAGRHRAETAFTWTKVAARVRQVYGELL